MAESTEYKILIKIKKAGRGSLFFIDDFVSFGPTKTVGKILERLVEKGEISRVARGIYSRLKQDAMLGTLRPTTEAIAIAIAKRDRARIIPTGAYALNALGLSTQVPLNVVYLTDGVARKIQMGRRKITFKKTTPRNLAILGGISGLVIQALKEIGNGKVTPEEEKKIVKLLQDEKRYNLEHDIRLAPEWIRKIMKRAL
ncbi:MAG: DUF6088 family protein [Mariniphaga sp.]